MSSRVRERLALRRRRGGRPDPTGELAEVVGSPDESPAGDLEWRGVAAEDSDEVSRRAGLRLQRRSLGLLGALELVPARPSRRFFANRGDVGTACRDLCVANGVISRAVRDTMIVAPPLVITPAEIDELVRRIGLALDQTASLVARERWV